MNPLGFGLYLCNVLAMSQLGSGFDQWSYRRILICNQYGICNIQLVEVVLMGIVLNKGMLTSTSPWCRINWRVRRHALPGCVWIETSGQYHRYRGLTDNRVGHRHSWGSSILTPGTFGGRIMDCARRLGLPVVPFRWGCHGFVRWVGREMLGHLSEGNWHGDTADNLFRLTNPPRTIRIATHLFTWAKYHACRRPNIHGAYEGITGTTLLGTCQK